MINTHRVGVALYAGVATLALAALAAPTVGPRISAAGAAVVSSISAAIPAEVQPSAVEVQPSTGIAADAPHPDTIQHLYQLCTGTSAEQAICGAYISGVSNALQLDSEYFSTPAGNGASAALRTLARVCTSPTVTYGEVQRAFIGWAEQHPEYWSYPAVTGVAEASKEMWPCL